MKENVILTPVLCESSSRLQRSFTVLQSPQLKLRFQQTSDDSFCCHVLCWYLKLDKFYPIINNFILSVDLLGDKQWQEEQTPKREKLIKLPEGKTTAFPRLQRYVGSQLRCYLQRRSDLIVCIPSSQQQLPLLLAWQ